VETDLNAVVQRARSNPTTLLPGDVRALQRSIGNRAVAQMLGRDTPPASSQSTRQSIRQSSHSGPLIQAKLTVGPANDVYEREADRIAQSVTQHVSASSQPAQRSPKPDNDEKGKRMPLEMPSIRRIQRSAPLGAAGGKLDPNVERRLRSSQAGGRPMPDAVRRSIEPKLGADLSGVKVHTGSQAIQLNRDLGAKAFTQGNHIYYGAGQSPHDLKLSAHEAVHTVQQGASATSTLQRKPKRVLSPKKAAKDIPTTAARYEVTLGVWRDDPNFLAKSTAFVFKKAAHQVFGGHKPKAPKSTGHSWVELRAFDSEGNTVFVDSYGFQPSGIAHPETGFHGTSGEDNLYRDYPVSRDKFINVIATAEAIVKENPKYDLKGMNCTKFAKVLVNAAGLKFMGARVSPGARIGPGKAFTPNRLYSAMSSKKKSGKTYKRTVDRGDTPARKIVPKNILTVYMSPYEGMENNEMPLEDPTKIKNHRPSQTDQGWSEFLVEQDGVEVPMYAHTDDLTKFLNVTQAEAESSSDSE